MIGAIAGDMSASKHEWRNIKTTDLSLSITGYTDDTVLTVAVADAILNGGDYASLFKSYARSFPKAGYGEAFLRWAMSDDYAPYDSRGNGAAVRVSPVGWAFDTLDEVLREAERSAAVTHNHPEGIKGAQAVAASTFLARKGNSKEDIKNYVEDTFGYDLSRSLDEIRPDYRFDVSCQVSVPQAIRAFYEANDWQHAVRLAISIREDWGTIACMAGGIAYAFFDQEFSEDEETSEYVRDTVERNLPFEMREVLWDWSMRYGGGL